MNINNQSEEAAAVVKAQMGFMIHLFVYVVVNAGLIALNLSGPKEHYWFIWPLVGWGIGIAFHALAVFVFPMGHTLRDRLMAREMKKRGLEKP